MERVTEIYQIISFSNCELNYYFDFCRFNKYFATYF